MEAEIQAQVRKAVTQGKGARFRDAVTMPPSPFDSSAGAAAQRAAAAAAAAAPISQASPEQSGASPKPAASRSLGSHQTHAGGEPTATARNYGRSSASAGEMAVLSAVAQKSKAGGS